MLLLKVTDCLRLKKMPVFCMAIYSQLIHYEILEKLVTCIFTEVKYIEFYFTLDDCITLCINFQTYSNNLFFFCREIRYVSTYTFLLVNFMDPVQKGNICRAD